MMALLSHIEVTKMPQIRPIRDLKNTTAISNLCHEIHEPIFIMAYKVQIADSAKAELAEIVGYISETL